MVSLTFSTQTQIVLKAGTCPQRTCRVYSIIRNTKCGEKNYFINLLLIGKTVCVNLNLHPKISKEIWQYHLSFKSNILFIFLCVIFWVFWWSFHLLYEYCVIKQINHVYYCVLVCLFCSGRVICKYDIGVIPPWAVQAFKQKETWIKKPKAKFVMHDWFDPPIVRWLFLAGLASFLYR